MNWNTFLGVACIIAYFLPVAVIIYNRFYTHRSLAALIIYYTMTSFYIMMSENIIPSSTSFRTTFGVLSNYLDVPLMLTVLLFFCPNKQKQRVIQLFTFLFIAYEVVITFIYGFQPLSAAYIMGPGIAIVLIYSVILFVRQAKFTIIHGKNMGRTVMLASILFAYACYALIYYFFYIEKTPFKNDVLVLYFISSFIASILMTIGLHLMRKRMKELESVKITRKELAMFFGQPV